MQVEVTVPPVFAPLWQERRRYKGAWGGRGSGKSHDRATHCVVRMLEGARIVGVREVQRSIADSVKQLVEDKIFSLGVTDLFEIRRDEIRGPNDSLMIFRGLKDHTAESIKSLENFDVCWIEESQTITRRSLMLLTPTIRAPGSEIWATWNPRLETDAIEVLLRGPNKAENAVVVQANFRDNPFFPDDLREDMERDKRMDESLYMHIWEGDYMLITEGAYYAKEISKARLAGRITNVPVERGPPISTAWDIGVDDATAIWVTQPAGREVRLIDYYENRGYDAAHYAQWVRDREYDSGMALLPHDAGAREKGTLKTYEDHLREAGIVRTAVLPQTRDVMNDVQECRGFLPRCVFDEHRCRKGLLALGSYRVEFDETLQTPKRVPVHDWACHGADAFRALVKGANRINTDAIAASHAYGPDVRINIPGVRRAARRGAGGGTTLGYNRGG